MMILFDDPKYGLFTNVVGTAGTLLAMASALLLGWKGRARWEPSEQDVDQGAQKVGGLAAAVIVAVIFLTFSKPENSPTLLRIALWCLVGTIASLLIYSSLITIYVRTQYSGTQDERKIIGGLFLRKDAQDIFNKEKAEAKERGEFPPTLQELFKGAIYDVDKLWSEFSRVLSKGLFNLAYMGLTVAGTVALACASIAIGLRH